MHQLVAQGVEYAFINTGSAEAGFYDAFLTVPGVQPILLLAENIVVSAADGYAKASNKPAFVNVHLAAGTRQGSGQMLNSYFDGTPMVVTAGYRENGSFGDHNTLGVASGFSQMGSVADVTKKRWEVHDARGIALATRRAFKEAATLPTGPVYLAFASAALDAKGVEATIQAASALESAQVPGDATLAAIHDALLNAERPLMVFGPDVRSAGAPRELLDRAERFAAGGCWFLRLRRLPMRHPHYVGMIQALEVPDEVTTWSAASAFDRTPPPARGRKIQDAGTIIAIGHDPSVMGNTFAVDLGGRRCSPHSERPERSLAGGRCGSPASGQAPPGPGRAERPASGRASRSGAPAVRRQTDPSGAAGRRDGALSGAQHAAGV
jgi:benzoylformate decarboxylase